MALLILFGFIAGAATAVSPCVLPVLPVALAAGATGGTPGSPIPVGGSADGTMYTSTLGISSRRNTL